MYFKKGKDIMKKGLLLLMAAVISMSLVSCGNKTSDSADGTVNTETSETAGTQGTDNSSTAGESTTPLPGTSLDNAADEVDMGKIDGTKLDDSTPEDSSLNDSADIGNFKVSIEDAKVIDYEGNKVVIVSFDFKNGNSTPMAFSGIMSVEATQNGSELRSVLVANVEGVNINSSIQEVESGKTITVQKAYLLSNETSDINIRVYKYGEPGGDSVSKAFKLS